MTEQIVPSSGTFIRDTWIDLLEGVGAWRLWSKFAWHDMLARYRRSWIGPLWLVLSAIIFIGAFSLVYGTLFKMDLEIYVPFVAIGIVTWGFLSSIAGESVVTFVESESYIRQVRVSLYVYVFRAVWRNVLVFFHQFIVAFVAVLIFNKLRPATLPLVIIGVLLLFSQAIWVMPLLGLLGARFRDLQPIIANVMQVLFFVTPVFWSPSLLGSRRWIADLNPLESLIAIVREPLLGDLPTIGNYAIVLAITAGGFLLAALVYGRFRTRVIYWL
jgi:ABC-type polysaccharide/polyol phosphate export permease